MSHNTQNAHDAPDEALTGRYASTIGWDPLQKPARSKGTDNEREIARNLKLAKDEYRTRQALARAIEVRSARELMRRDPDEDPQPTNAATTLFPPFWYPGQLAILTGPPDGTLSLFATQLAETIARSQVNSEQLTVNNDRMSVADPSLFTVHSSLFTCYVDLARTRRQYREIYTHNGRRYRFSQHLNFGLLAGEPLPERYKGRREAFYHDAIATKLGEIDEPTVAIIDNLSWLLRSGSPTELRQLLRSFRSHVNHTGNSILLLAPDGARAPSPGSSLVTRHSPLVTGLAEFADTVFSLNPSTFSPDHRYLKLLKSSSFPTDNGQLTTDDPDSSQFSVISSQLASPVHVYQLTRSSSPPSLLTAGAPAGAAPRGVGAHSSPLTKASPFPGFQFIGTSAEELHTRDYAAEIAKFEATVLRAVEKEERRRKLSAKESLAQGIIDGSYQRYLLGE